MGEQNSGLGGVGSASHIQQTPSTDAADQARTKEVTHEGRTWKQKFDSIKAAIIRIFTFSRNKSSKAPAIKKDSVTVVKGGAEPSKAELKKQAKADKAEKTQKTEKADKAEPPKSEAIAIKQGGQKTAKEKVEDFSQTVGNKAGGAVAKGVTGVVQTVGNIALGAMQLPRKMTGKETQKPETESPISVIPARVAREENKKVFAVVEAISEFRATERTHKAAVARDLKIINTMLAKENRETLLKNPETLSGLSKEAIKAGGIKPPTKQEIAGLEKFAVDFKAYSELTESFHDKLNTLFATLDNDSIDLAQVAQDLEKLFSSDYEALHKAGEKVADSLEQINPIIRNEHMVAIAAKRTFSNELFQFEPAMHPVQRMTRYPLMLRDMIDKVSNLDNLPPNVIVDLQKAKIDLDKAVQATNTSNQIKLLKEYVARPDKLKNTFDLNNFRKYMTDFKVYEAPPKQRLAGMSQKELAKAIKIDIGVAEKNIASLLKEMEKNPAGSKDKIAKAEGELAKLKFALENYKTGSRKKIAKWEAALQKQKG